MNFQAVKSFKTTKKAPFFTHMAATLDYDSTLIYTSDSCNNIRLHTDNGAVLLTSFNAKPQSTTVTAISFNVRHNVAIVGYSNGELVFFKQSGKENNSKAFKPHNLRINYIESSSDQNKIITCSNDKVIKIYDLKRNKGFVKPVFAMSVSSHTGFVLKACLSDNLFSVYSVDPRVFRITDLKNKTDTCVYEANSFKGIFQSFHEMKDGLVMLQYESKHFEVLDSRVNQVVKSFTLDMPSLLKIDFAIEANKLFAASRRDKGVQTLIALDVKTGDKQQFTMSFEITDLQCDRRGEKFLIGGEGDVVLYLDQMATKPDSQAKARPKLDLGAYNNISSIVPATRSMEKLGSEVMDRHEEKPVEANPAQNTEAYAQLMNKLGKYAASIQVITNSLKLLDDKIELNEMTVSNLNKDIELIANAREARNQGPQLNELEKDFRQDMGSLLNTQRDSCIQLIEDSKNKEIRTYYEPQIKIDYQPFLTLKEQMQSDLDLLRNFMADKDTVSDKMVESNFSFMRNESYNVFDNVIGQKFKEDTANFVGISEKLPTVDRLPQHPTFKSTSITQQLGTSEFNYTLSNLT